jgi:phospholipid/cholesterol/gamma-HCH transport system substrate-binding protein
MKKDRFKDTSMEVTVGAFMFMVLLTLGIFTIVLSRQNFLKKTYHLNVKFESVMGLREGDNVFLRGVPIGKIKTLKIEQDGVEVMANLEEPVTLHQDYRIEILPSSVLGGKYLNVNVGSLSAPAVPANEVVRGVPPADLVDEATRTIKEIRRSLEEGQILDNLQTIMAQVKEVTTQLSEGKGTLGKLLMDDTVYNDLQQITTNLKSMSQNLADGKGTLGRLLSPDDTLYNDLAAASASIKNITASLEKGEGTLGKLVKDEALYNDAKDLLNEARAAIDDIREAMPITTFSSIFFGAF